MKHVVDGEGFDGAFVGTPSNTNTQRENRITQQRDSFIDANTFRNILSYNKDTTASAMTPVIEQLISLLKIQSPGHGFLSAQGSLFQEQDNDVINLRELKRLLGQVKVRVDERETGKVDTVQEEGSGSSETQKQSSQKKHRNLETLHVLRQSKLATFMRQSLLDSAFESWLAPDLKHLKFKFHTADQQ